MKRAAAFGIAGPIGFLALSFAMAGLRPELIRAQRWASWPSSMALGGLPGVAQTVAFLWLGLCYVVFSLGALRPGLGSPIVWGGMLAVAMGDLLLAFTTDAPGVDPTWHGAAHLLGVLLATVATLMVAGGVTFVTRDRAAWRPWRFVAPVPFVAAVIGLVGGFDLGWAKVVYVIGVTLPAVAIGWLLRRDADAGAARPLSAARSG